MTEPFELPPPALIGDTINLGPAITPAFVDATDWSAYLPPHETREVRFEHRDLTARDEAAARAPGIALESVRVAGLLDGKRHAVLGVGTRALDRVREVPVVTIYNYSDDLTVEVLVDVEAREVLAVAAEPATPALTAAEQADALDIVRSDGRLPAAGVDVDTGTGIIVAEVNFRERCHGHRLVDLRFGPPEYRMPTAFAIVDLSAERVVRVGLLTREL